MSVCNDNNVFLFVFTEPVEFVGNNYFEFSKLPVQMKNMYKLKSYKIMAEWIFDECYDVLFNFVNKKKIDVCINTTYCKIVFYVRYILCVISILAGSYTVIKNEKYLDLLRSSIFCCINDSCSPRRKSKHKKLCRRTFRSS